MHDLAPYAITAVFGILGWLLKNKDEAQAKEIIAIKAQAEKDKEELLSKIDILFKKHDLDASALQDLRVAIAEGHYKKVELDYKFEKIELAITNSFSILGNKFDNLSNILITHVREEDAERMKR